MLLRHHEIYFLKLSEVSKECRAKSIGHLSTILFIHFTVPAILKLVRGQALRQQRPCMEIRVSVLCIDNWSQFGGPKRDFLNNIDSVKSPDIKFQHIERDFREIDYNSIGTFNIYFFDGPHDEADQYDGIKLAQPALADQYVLIVDDWNWRRVRFGTFQAIYDLGSKIECSIEVRTTNDETFPYVTGKSSDWHNGYFIGVVLKKPQ